MRFEDLPIKRKVVSLMLQNSIIVLLAAATCLLIYEYRSYRREMAAKLTAMAAIIADNSSAVLAFDDASLARVFLSSLNAEPEVTAAALYDQRGVLFSWFPTNRPLADFPARLSDAPQAGFAPDHYVVLAPVLQGTDRMGTVFLRADYRQMYQRFTTYSGLLLIVLLGAAGLALYLANMFEWRISHPLLKLAEVAQRVSHKDYSVRATAPYRDEVGFLTEAFNSMLDQIQQRDAALREREERYELVVAGAEAAIWDWDVPNKRVLYSPRWIELRGLSDEETTDSETEWVKGIHPDDRERVMAAVNAHFEGRTAVFAEEYRVQHRDGHWFWIMDRGIARRDAAGRAVRMAGSETDITERKRAEEALRRSEMKYRTIFEGVAISLWEEDFSGVKIALDELRADGVTDFAGYFATNPEFVDRAAGLIRVLDVNDTTVKMFEAWNKAELLGPLPDIFTPESRIILTRELIAVAEGQSFMRGEAQLKTLRRTPISVLFTMTLPPGTDSFDRVLFSLVDITQRRHVEQALLESERRFRMIADNITVLAWTSDANFGATWYNKQWYDYSGTTPDQMRGRGWERLHHPQHLERVRRTLRGALESRQPWEDTFPLRGRDGKFRWFLSRAVPILDEAGNIERWFGTNSDVTELHEAQQSIARLAAIVESSQDAIISKTLTGEILTWNRGAERMFGYTAEEVIGKSIRILIPAERMVEEDSILARQRRGEPIEHFETIRVRKDGTCLEVSLSISPIRDSSGAIVGISKIARDVTEKKRADRELERALAAAEAANRTKDDFLAGLSHELRTPMMPVMFTISMLQQDQSLPPRLRDSLGVVRRNIEIQSRMINDLLDLSRIRANRLELAAEVTDLHESVGRALEVCRSHPKYAGLHLKLRLDATEHHVFGDADRLQQVFWNLIQNAMKFTPPGGTLTVSSRNRADAIQVCVTDTGCGIEPELLQKIFEPFEQGGRKGREALQGLGLGLAIAQRIAAAHGGTLRADSEGRDRGATFTVELQTVSAPAPQPQQSLDRTELITPNL